MFEYDPFSKETLDDPYAAYKRLRDEAPVYYGEAFDCWFLSRFEDIWKALNDMRSYTTKHGVTPDQLLTPQRQEFQSSAIAGLDPPVHTRARAAISDIFKPGAIAALEPWVREIVRGFIDEVYERGEMDVLHDVALRTSVRVACRIGGLPLEDADMLSDWVMKFFQREPGTRGVTQGGQEASLKLHDYLVRFATERRRSGERPDDLTSILVHEEFEGALLTEEQISGHLNLLVVGGTETLPKVFATGVRRLWEHPGQRAELATRPDRVPTAFQEMLRYDMPTQMLGRVMARDKQIGEHTLEAGQGLLFLWPAGNRDEREFDKPDRFDIHRDAPRILTFGHGTHTCLGAHAARMEGKVLVQELLARVPEYEVIEERSRFMPSEFLRGYESLTISFDPY